eukprot:507147-Prorocentrum_minimum.AAC.1
MVDTYDGFEEGSALEDPFPWASRSEPVLRLVRRGCWGDCGACGSEVLGFSAARGRETRLSDTERLLHFASTEGTHHNGVGGQGHTSRPRNSQGGTIRRF